jgi:hypothetical protein
VEALKVPLEATEIAFSSLEDKIPYLRLTGRAFQAQKDLVQFFQPLRVSLRLKRKIIVAQNGLDHALLTYPSPKAESQALLQLITLIAPQTQGERLASSHFQGAGRGLRSCRLKGELLPGKLGPKLPPGEHGTKYLHAGQPGGPLQAAKLQEASGEVPGELQTGIRQAQVILFPGKQQATVQSQLQGICGKGDF